VVVNGRRGIDRVNGSLRHRHHRCALPVGVTSGMGTRRTACMNFSSGRWRRDLGRLRHSDLFRLAATLITAPPFVTEFLRARHVPLRRAWHTSL
jgi:hypothetical protein